MTDKQEKLTEPVMLHIWIERFDRNWLRAEAKKKKISIASILRELIKKFINAKD